MSRETKDHEEHMLFLADYDGVCEVCGSGPTVVVAAQNGDVISALNLCGPCCFGTAEALDPGYWESSL